MLFRTPPLPALKAFSAFVLTGSVGAAARDLSLTKGAVAYQIRELERFLDVQLVQKHGRTWALTDTGRHYGYQVRQALDDLAHATQFTRQAGASLRAQRAVRVAVLPSFAHGWLLPRLPRFFKMFPQVRLAIQASMANVDLGSGLVDCAIRFGHGQWPDTVVRHLMHDSLLLVGSSELLGGRSGLTLAQIMQLPQLHSSENMARWLSSMDEAYLDLDRKEVMLDFTDSTHLLDAAQLGLGVGLTRRSIADHRIQRGDLMMAFEHECLHASSYYALLPAAVQVRVETEQFLNWLQAECLQFSQSRGFPVAAM